MQVEERKQGGNAVPGDAPANAADVAALEAVLRRDGRFEDLIRLHDRTEPGAAPDRLLELLEREASSATGPERAADALVAQGRLLAERVGRPERALLAFQRALRLQPNHPVALARSREILLQLGRVEAAFDAAAALADAGATAAEAAAAFLEVARAAAARPTFHPVAREAALRAREAEPGPAGELLAALEATAAGFREEVRTLRNRAVEERDRRAAARLYLRIAELHAAYDAHATGPAKVHENLERAFLLWPGMPDALDFLERRAESAADPRGLAADFERFAAATPDPRGRQDILLRLSAVHLVRRNDRAASLAALERAFALDASRSEAAIGLVEALHEAGRHAESADVLERHLATVGDGGTAAELRLRLAAILADHVGDLARARAEVLAVLATAPEHPRAEDLLERVLARAPDPAARAGLLERRAARAASAADRAELLEAAAAALPAERGEERLRLLGAALTAAPERTVTLGALERLAAEGGLWEPFAALLRAAAAGAPKAAALPLLRRAAEVLSSELGRPAEAVGAWREVATLAPDDDDAQAELERCLALSGDFEALAERIRVALAAAVDGAERRLLLARLARHYETAARDPAAAADVYRELLAEEPGDPVVLGKLAATLGALERWEAQLDVLRELAEQPGPAGLAARVRCAALLVERLDRPEEAVELYAGVYHAEPELPGVVPALERLLSSGIEARRIAALLAPRYAELGAWPHLLGALDLQLAGTRDPVERRALLLRIAAVHEERLGDPRAAFAAVSRAFAEDPSAAGLPSRLEALAAACGLVAELAGQYRRAWDAAEPAVARELATRVAALAEGPLADPALAAAAWERRLELDATDDRALTALAARAEAEGRWDDAAALVGRRLDLTGGEARGALERLRAELLARAGRPAEAAGGYRAAIAAGEPEAEALPLLAEALEAAGARDELAPVLDRLAALAREEGDADQAVRLELRAATLVDERGGREAAIERFGAILSRSPSEPDALAALERRLDDPYLGPRAARALIPAYEAAKEYHRLAAALEIEAAGANLPADRAAILGRLARIRGAELRDAQGAFAALLAAVREVPTDAALRADLLDAAREADGVEEAAATLADLARGIAAAPAEAAALERELAVLAEHERNDPAAAAGHLERVLALVPGDEDALRNLRRLRRTLGAWEPLHEACLALADVTADDAERVALYREAGTIAEDRLGDPTRAADDFHRLVELRPADPEAWASLDRLAGALGRVHDQAAAIDARRELLLATAPAGADADRLRELTFRLAVLTRDELGDEAAAVPLFAAVLASDPADAGAREALGPVARGGDAAAPEAFRALDEAYAATGDHLRRAELREARFDRADAPERDRLLEELRALQERDLGRPELAFLTACRGFLAGADRERLAPELERLARKTDSFEELADVYERAAEDAAEDAAALLRRAAVFREAELQDAEGATRLWRAVLAAAPADRAALDALARLYEDGRKGQELYEVYRRNADLAAGAERIEWLLRLGRLAAGVLGDDERAIACYREALALDPAHRPALEALDPILWKDRRSRHGEVLDVLRRLAECSPEGSAERQRLLFRIAQEQEDHAFTLVDPGLRAAAVADALAAYAEALAAGDGSVVAHLERLLARDETRVGAARLLEEVYRARGDRGRLADVLDLLRVAPEEAGRRKERLVELASLREALGDRRAAFSAAIALFREAPEDATVLSRLVGIAETIGGHEELAGVLEDELEGRPDGDPLVPALLRPLAPLDAGPLGRPRAAAAAWERLFAITGDAAVLDDLEDLYRREGQLAELVTIYRRRFRLSPDADARRELGTEMANLMERLGDKDGAVDALREILALDEGDENAVASLSRLLGDTGRWPELADLIGRQIEQARANGLEAEARELTYKLGRVRQVRLADPAGALARFQEVLAGEPRHGRTLAALEELSKSDDATARALAAEVLAPIYEAEKDWQRLVQALEALAAVAAPGEARTVHLRRIAEIYAGPLASPEMALVAAGRALREHPDDPAALALALAAGDAGELADELCELLLAAADRAATDDGRLTLLREAARRLDAAGDAARARDAWRRVRILAADDDEALVALARLHRAAGELEAYLEILRTRLVRAEDPALRRQLLLDLAAAQEEARDVPAALSSLRRVLESEPLDADALRRMDRLCTGAERWADLALVLEREAGAAGDDFAARRPFLLRLAGLKESRLLDRDGAVEIYRDVLAAAPGEPETVARLEALLARDPGLEGAAALLESAYLATGAWAKYAAALDERASATADPEARKATLVTLAEVRERRQDRPDLAFIALARAFRDDPADPGVRDALERLARDTSATEELAALYEEELPRIRATSVAADVALRLGTLAEGREGAEAARAWYERARELDPEVGARALPALDRIHRAAERWPELADVLEARAALEAEPEERVSALFRLAALAEERLGQRDRAAAAYERIVELDRRHLPSLRSLERLYEEAGRFDRLHDVLLAQRDAAVDPAARDRLSVRLADVAAKGLKDPRKAIAHLDEVLARSPRHEAAMKALEGLYEVTGRWKELAALLEARLQSTVEPREIARLHEKRGWVLSTKLEEGEEALRSYLSVLERDPRNRRALEAVRDLQRERGELENLAATLRRLVPLQDDAVGVKAARLELAKVLAALGRREEAIDNARRTLDVEPHDDALLAGAEELLLSQAAFSDAVRAMELRASRHAAAGRTDEAAALWERIARLWEERLGRKEGAAQALEKLLDLRPDDEAAFEHLRAIYRALADWRRTAIAMERHATAVEEPGQKLALLVELARLHEERLGQKEVALGKLGAALELSPGDAEIRRSLRRLADDTGGHEELAMLLEHVADAQARGETAASLYLELGRLQDEVLDEPEDAEASFRRILEFDPVNSDALDALARLFERRGDARPYVLALEQKLEAVASLEEKKAILHAIARTYDERLNDVGEAVYTLKRALEFDAGDRITVEALSAIYRREGRHAELAELWARARDLTPDHAEQVERQLALAALTENELSDVEGAVQAYARVLELDPACSPALDALERLYTRLDRPAELLGIVERRMELSVDGRERARLLLRAASIREQGQGDVEGAIACFESVLQIEPENLAAVRGLERLLSRDGDAERQIAALERHLAMVERDPAAKAETVALHVRIGALFLEQLERADRAETWLTRALELDPDCRPALSGLARIYEAAGNWPLALEHLRREARLAGAAGEAVDLFHRAGRIEEEMLHDQAAARRSYERALGVDPGHLPSLRSLKGLLERGGDLDGYLEVLVQEASHAVDPDEKTRLWDDVGRFQLETRDDPEEAIRAFEEARRQSPDDAVAARGLADLYVAREDWARAESCLDVVCAHLAGTAGTEAEQELTQRSYRLGFIAERLGNAEKALSCFRRSHDLDPTFLPAAEGLARLLVGAGELVEARNVYQGILLHHREDLSDPEVVELHNAIGDLRRRLGEPEAALKSLRSALELDPYHPEALRSLVAILEEGGRFEPAFEHRRRLLDVLEGDERRRALLETATIAREKLGDPYQAIDALTAALRLDPQDAAAFEVLASLYRETRQAPKLAETLERLLAVPSLEREAAVKAHLEVAGLYRGDLRGEPDSSRRATEHLEAALELDWKQAAAFQALEQTLGAARDWAGLEAAYVRMLGRIPKEDGTRTARVLLYRTLGDLYLRALKNPSAALEAYRAVTLLAPDDAAGAQALADLLSKKPGSEAEGIVAHRAALRLAADPTRSAKALVGLHARRKEFDRALVAAQVVTHLLGQGGADEAGIVARLDRFAKTSAGGSLGEVQWTLLTHEKARTPVAEVLGLLQEHAGQLFAVDPARLELAGRPTPLDPKARVDLARSELFFVGAYVQVARALGVAPMPLYQVAAAKGLHVVGTHPVALVAGEELFGTAPKKKELYYLLAKRLAFARTGLTMAGLHRAESLELLVQAAIGLGEPGYRPTGDGREVERIRKQLEKTLSPEARRAIGTAGARLLRDPAKPDVRSYVEGAELTATRAATLLAADVEVAVRCLEADPGTAARLPVEVRKRDLVTFCLGEEFFRLRQALRLAVEIPA